MQCAVEPYTCGGYIAHAGPAVKSGGMRSDREYTEVHDSSLSLTRLAAADESFSEKRDDKWLDPADGRQLLKAEPSWKTRMRTSMFTLIANVSSKHQAIRNVRTICKQSLTVVCKGSR